MKKSLFIVLLLLVGCTEYNGFYNPQTFNSLASRRSFQVNGNYLKPCFCEGSNDVTVSAIHEPTGIPGVLHFQRNRWYDENGKVCEHIQMYFVPVQEQKEAYNKFLVVEKDTLTFTKEEILPEEDVTPKQQTKRFTLD